MFRLAVPSVSSLVAFNSDCIILHSAGKCFAVKKTFGWYRIPAHISARRYLCISPAYSNGRWRYLDDFIERYVCLIVAPGTYQDVANLVGMLRGWLCCCCHRLNLRLVSVRSQLPDVCILSGRELKVNRFSGKDIEVFSERCVLPTKTQGKKIVVFSAGDCFFVDPVAI